MHESYDDIKSRITEEPTWYDQNGVPRYSKFEPKMCPNIYSDIVVLMRIACQNCAEEFLAEIHAGLFDDWYHQHAPKEWHYGDPPIHDCVGDTMNCEDLEIVEVWYRDRFNWVRKPEFEGSIDQA